jgi:Fur family zinc uptake transcriptional regulator
VSAYEILDRLDHNGRRPAPPMVYRALEFLLTQGLVHRVESRNAFIGCAQPGTAHLPEILLCTECGGAAEVADGAMARALATQAAGLGFETHRQTIELSGRCADCRAHGGKAGTANGAGAETPAHG